MMASLMAGKAAMGSLCAPPSGSGMISSMIRNLTSSGDVMRSASVACAIVKEGVFNDNWATPYEFEAKCKGHADGWQLKQLYGHNAKRLG